jgi:hypothetical protein
MRERVAVQVCDRFSDLCPFDLPVEPPEIDRQGDQIPLAGDVVQTPEAEPPESQNRFDPAEGRLGDGFRFK